MEETSSRPEIKLQISHKGTHHSLSLPPTSTLEFLQLRLEELTSVPPPLQKLLYKGKKTVNPEDTKTVTIESVGLKDGMKVTMLGSTERELGAMQEAVDEKKRREEILAKRVGGKVRSTSSHNTPFPFSVPSNSPYKFHNITPLAHLPSPSTAQALLSKLASDPAILHVMHKHQLAVGTLTELAPHEHHPHLKGLNESNGKVILLRIRTDAYDGFRLYSDIRRVLCHELAHNVWGGHGEGFKTFNSQLKREVAEYEHSIRENSHTLGGEGPVYYSPDPTLEASAYTHILGGSSPSPAADTREERRRLALEAAMGRLQREEEELEDSCGTAGAGKEREEAST